MTWQEIAKNLPVGHKTRSDCPQCGEGTNTNAAIINHAPRGYSLYCNACSYNPFEAKGQMTLAEIKRLDELNELATKPIEKVELPHDFTTDIPRAGRLWLYSGGLTPSVWKQYGIGYSALYDRVVLPVFDTQGDLVWFQCRAIHKGQIPKYIQPSRDRSNILFRAGKSESDILRVVLVEDILSAIRVGKHIPTASLLGTKITNGQAKKLGEFTQITTWLDSDRAGRKGAYTIRKTLGLICEDVTDIVTTADPKKLTDQQIKEVLQYD